MFERLKRIAVATLAHLKGVRRPKWTTEDYYNAFYRDDPDIKGCDMEDFVPPTPQQRHLMELGLTRYAGGLQSSVGFFSRHTTRTKMATEILEILSAALAADIKIDFGTNKGPDDKLAINTHHLERIIGPYFLSVSVRIDQENHDRNCNGFVPEEKEGGFGILVRVSMSPQDEVTLGNKRVRWSRGGDDEFCKEIFNSPHLADPSCDLEIAVAGIKHLVNNLTPKKQWI